MTFFARAPGEERVAFEGADPAALGPAAFSAWVQELRDAPAQIGFAAPPGTGATRRRRARDGAVRGWGAALKRVEDVLGAAVLLLWLLPLLLVIAVAVRLDTPGPVLFRQVRYGRGSRPIEVLKFRTMRHECRDEAGAVQALPGDDRVTAVGRLLRRFSLDELPQLLNVLGGSMSLVGPRPHAIHTRAGGVLFEDAVPDYFARHAVKPGITGLAQVRGWRGPTASAAALQSRLDCDLEYIRRWSLLLDLQILLRTAPEALRARNAC